MLKQIKVRNYKNFRDELVFSLDTPNNYEFNSQLIKNNIINKGIIIGKNASGKTNLGFAIMDIMAHVTDKATRNERPYTNLYNEDTVAHFEYTFALNDSTLVYKYDKTQYDVAVREELYIDGELVLVKDVDKRFVKLKGAENLNLPSMEELSLVKYVYANTVLDENDHNSKTFLEFIKFVNGMLWFSSTEGYRYIGLVNGTGDLYEKILEIDKTPKNLENFLREMGIEYTLVARDMGDRKNIFCKMGEKEVPLSWVVSSGTRALIFFFFWYLQYEKVSFVYIDEFDAFYHTELARAIVEKLVNYENYQTIITTHNTDLMTNEILRPDCIFELNDNKIQSFSELTPKVLREAHNLQKMYKAGAFHE